MPTIFVKVTVEDLDISDRLINVQVEESDAQADMAFLTFRDNSLELSSTISEGLSVEIDLGWKEGHALIFRGLITGIRAHFLTRGEPQVEVQAVDSLILLGLRPKTQRWWNTTISQMVEDIARANQLTPGKIKPTQDIALDEFRPYQQIEETDLAFLLRLAQDFDAKLYVEHSDNQDSLNFVATRYLMAADPIEEKLVFNLNLEEFSPSFDAFATMPEMRLVTTDPVTSDAVEISEDLANSKDAAWVPDPKRIARLGDGSSRLSQLWAKTALKQKKLQSFWQIPPRLAGAPSRYASNSAGTFGNWAKRLGQTAQGRASGSIWLRPRRRVVVEGCGGRWSGDNWYLAQVQHQIDIEQRSYICSFVCTR